MPGAAESPGIRSAACPSSTLCVMGDDSGRLLSSTDPGGGAAAWSAPTQVDGTNGPLRPVCPTAQLCLFVDRAGNAWSTTTASDPDASWSHVAIDPGHALIGLACPDADLCIAADADGGVLTSDNPSAPGGSPWGPRMVVAPHLSGLSCPPATSVQRSPPTTTSPTPLA